MAEQDGSKPASRLGALFREKFDGLQGWLGEPSGERDAAGGTGSAPPSAQAVAETVPAAAETLAADGTEESGAESSMSESSDRRQEYRKNLRGRGLILRGSTEPLAFQIINLSLGGVEAVFRREPGFQQGDVVNISLPDLKLQGWAAVAHIHSQQDGSQIVGLTFTVLDGVDGNSYSS